MAIKEGLLGIGRAAALASAIGFSSCGDGPDQTSPTPSETTSQGIDLLGQSKLYLDELSLLTPVENQIINQLKIPTAIHNASSYRLDIDVAKNVYLFLEGISEVPVRFITFNNAAGEQKAASFAFREGITNREVFIVGESLPRPRWIPSSSDAHTASASSAILSPDAITFLTFNSNRDISTFSSEAEGLSAFFLTEACQTTIEAFVYNPETNKNDTDQVENLRAQELFCNSLSIAMYARMKGMIYQEYLSFGGTMTINVPGVGLNNVKPISIPEQVFQSMPTDLRVVK